MKIAQLATNVEQVPPEGYGGTELIVSLVTEELVRRGHEVTLFATGNSKSAAKLVSIVDEPLRGNSLPRRWQAYDIRLLLKLRQMQSQFDIVHNHMGYQALPYLDSLECPVVTTIHNPIKDYCAPIYLEYKHQPFVAISQSFKRLNYPEELNYAAVVYNGIDIDQYRMDPKKSRNYLLFVGRICQDKGTATAIKIARKLGLPLKIAGKVDQTDQEYFETEVKPLLDSSMVEYIGEVHHSKKVELYSGAIAVLYPIEFDEPFGLVMVEALASGSPVMAFDRGSVREILIDGQTGLIGKSADELVARFPELNNISASACRQKAVEQFSAKRMVDDYLQLYGNLIYQRAAQRQLVSPQ